MLARVGMDYGVVSDLHNMHFGVWAETFTSQPHRAPVVEVEGVEEHGIPRHSRLSMAYNNGPHSGSRTHLALSDKWF